MAEYLEDVEQRLEALFRPIIEFKRFGVGLIAFDIGYSHGIAS
jgi:hypothetical protein